MDSILDTKDWTYEERIYRDCNGFYNAQSRILPLMPWEPGDGWGTFFITTSLDSAKQRCQNPNTIEVVYAERFRL